MTTVATVEAVTAAAAFEAAGLIADLLVVIEDTAADLLDSALSTALTATRADLVAVGDRLAQLIQLERLATQEGNPA